MNENLSSKPGYHPNISQLLKNYELLKKKKIGKHDQGVNPVACTLLHSYNMT
jgi:hypothetical protein